MKVLFLVNPNAGGRGAGRKVRIAHERFLSAGWSVTLENTGTPEHAGRLISSAHDDGCDLLVLAGGDGTLHHAIQHLPLGSHDKPSTLPFGIIPLGSGNDFYRGTGAPWDPEGAADNIINGRDIPIDIGICEPVDDACNLRNEQSIRFVNTAGVGIDSQTLATREKAPKFLSARYELLFLVTLVRLYPLKVSIQADDWDLDGDYYMVLCCNNGWFGTGMEIAPGAKINDGLFDVLTVRKTPKWKFVVNLHKVFKGTHIYMEEAEILKTRSLVLRCEPGQRVATDGDRACPTPVRISCIPGGVSLRTCWLNDSPLT